jgi:dTDP-4-dehydrorhamnose reductase
MSEHERTRFCIIGGDGAIGSALEKRLRARGVAARSSTRRESVDPTTQFSLDLRGDLTDVAIPECDVIVLAATMAKLADCRADPETARRVNVDAQVNLARRAARSGAFVVFLSTSQVFDGTRSSVAPDETPAPRSLYGRLKAEAEMKLLQLDGEVAVIRLSKVIGRHLLLFESWRRELLRGKTINAFEDLVMAPIAMEKVVAGIETIGLRRLRGVWHLGGREDMNYVEAGRHLARRLGADEALVCAASAAAAGIPADERPAHTALARGELEAITGIRIENAGTELDIGLGLGDCSQKDERG